MTEYKEKCTHASFTGYGDYCVCNSCGWIIEYNTIDREKNDASLSNYIKTILEESGENLIERGAIEFDIGVNTQGIVEEHGTNRIKFKIFRSMYESQAKS